MSSGGRVAVVSSSVVTVTPDARAIPAIYTGEMGELFAYRGVRRLAGWLAAAAGPGRRRTGIV